MQNLQRLRELKPWDNVSEEDLFQVDGLYLQVRGNVRRPNGVRATRDFARASAWVTQPEQAPSPDDWRLNADTGEVSAGQLATADVEKALDQVLDQFEGKPTPGVQFPIALNY